MKEAVSFLAVMVIVYYITPLAYPPADLTLIQAASITLLAFVARAVLAPIYLVNGSNDEEEID